jgi:hypothetical protein
MTLFAAVFVFLLVAGSGFAAFTLAVHGFNEGEGNAMLWAICAAFLVGLLVIGAMP